MSNASILQVGFDNADFMGEYSAKALGEKAWNGFKDTIDPPEFNPYKGNEGIPVYSMNDSERTNPLFITPDKLGNEVYLEREVNIPTLKLEEPKHIQTKQQALTTTVREVPLEVPKVPLDISFTKNIKLDNSFTKNIKPITFDTDFYKNLKPDNTLIKRVKLENSKNRTDHIKQQSLKDLNTSFNPFGEIDLNDSKEIPKMSKLPIIIFILGISSYYFYKKKK